MIYSLCLRTDLNGDGILSWEDFELLAEKFTKIQRKGKLEKEVLDRWKTIFKKLWTQLTSAADYNTDSFVEFEEWISFFKELRALVKSHNDLPEFLKTYLQLLFLTIDSNREFHFSSSFQSASCIKIIGKTLFFLRFVIIIHNCDLEKWSESN